MDGRLRARPDRREENSLRRALRDRAILLQEHAEKDRELAAMRALLAKQNADGLGSQLERAERESADAHTAGDPEAIARANRRMAELAGGARYPAKLLRVLGRAEGNAVAVEQVGTHYAAQQCMELLNEGVDGIHFYTLNKSRATLDIFRSLGLNPGA